MTGRRERPRTTTRPSTRARLGATLIAATFFTSLLTVPFAPAAHAESAKNGRNPADAAASCWEIRQVSPTSTSGSYWLLTNAMERPQQFYCDMDTDGGGWVLVGRGREGWTFRDYGQNTPQQVHANANGPNAFAPAALSSTTIDELLANTNVSDLEDGVRLRRAVDISGRTFQEVRWNMADLESWSWAFGGGHRLSSWRVGSTTGTGSNTKSSSVQVAGEVGDGNDGSRRFAWFTFPWVGHGRSAGFSYGGSIDGRNNSTSYLWEYAAEKHAIPFTQVFVRPKLLTTQRATIPNEGTPAQAVTPLLSRRMAELDGGVTGVLKFEDSEPRLDTPVLALTTAGDRVYVGGKFRDVETGKGASSFDQPYLAAFDRSTGAWISAFRPDLDGTVWDLVVADGRLIVAGQFSDIDGVDGTAGLAALDLSTGEVDETWRASLTIRNSSDRPYARTLQRDGEFIYVGGNFTGIESNTALVDEARLGRVSVADGTADPTFRPDVDGVPYDLAIADERVYVAGFFDGVNGNDHNGFDVVSTLDGSEVTGLSRPLWSDPRDFKQYQQAVTDAGGNIWQGGSQHNVHVYAKFDYSLQRTHLTSGNGGDTQAFAPLGDVMYQGSHGNSWIYSDATAWPELTDYSRVDDYEWIGAFDTATGNYIKTFTPSMSTANDEGAWALHTDEDGCLWFGGDFDGGSFVNGSRQYLQGFSKFCQRDTTPPSAPATASASLLDPEGVKITWAASTDDRPGFIGYEVLRNDRVVSPLVYGNSFIDQSGNDADRYFVRAVDAESNRSASTSLVTAGDDQRPTVPRDLTAELQADNSIDVTWTASTDDVAVSSYHVLRNGIILETLAAPQVSTTLADLGEGAHWIQVRAVDSSGNESYNTPPIRVDIVGPDVQRPSTPTDLTAVFDSVSKTVAVEWAASTDDVGVVEYEVRSNGVAEANVDGDTLTVTLDLEAGNRYIQVQAIDEAGNGSFRTQPVVVAVVLEPDFTRPSVPQNLIATVAADNSIELSWTSSIDNVGVTQYRLLRNSVEVALVGGEVNTATLELGSGSHWLQVQAIDAAGNESFRTPTLRVDANSPDADTTAPTTPRNLQASVHGDGAVEVSWTASTDAVGVTQYVVFRNLVEVASTADTTVTVQDLGSGAHYIQVQAFDAAGNESFKTNTVLVRIP